MADEGHTHTLQHIQLWDQTMAHTIPQRCQEDGPQNERGTCDLEVKIVQRDKHGAHHTSWSCKHTGRWKSPQPLHLPVQVRQTKQGLKPPHETALHAIVEKKRKLSRSKVSLQSGKKEAWQSRPWTNWIIPSSHPPHEPSPHPILNPFPKPPRTASLLELGSEPAVGGTDWLTQAINSSGGKTNKGHEVNAKGIEQEHMKKRWLVCRPFVRLLWNVRRKIDANALVFGRMVSRVFGGWTWLCRAPFQASSDIEMCLTTMQCVWVRIRSPCVYRFTVSKVFLQTTFLLRSELETQSAQESRRCHGRVGKVGPTTATSGPLLRGKKKTVGKRSSERKDILAWLK